MGLSSLIQKNQPIVVILAVVLIGGSIFAMLKGDPKPAHSNQAWFYDLGSGELFLASRTQTPPIDAPGGAGQGVRAFVYACGECDAASQQTVYLMKFTAEAAAAMKNVSDEPSVLSAIDQGSLVAAAPEKVGDELQWHTLVSPQGAAVLGRVKQLCGADKATLCKPQ